MRVLITLTYVQGGQIRISLFDRIIRFSHKRSIPVARHRKEVSLSRVIAWHVGTHSFNQRSDLISSIFQRYAFIRIRAKDQVHVDLNSLQLSAIVLVLVGIKRIHHVLKLFDHAVSSHVAFCHLRLRSG